MSGFDKGEFHDDLDLVEDYLGYLKGNELMHQYFRDWQISQSKIHSPAWPMEFNYSSPCDNSRFKVEFTHYPLLELVLGEGQPTSDLDVQIAELKENLDQSWYNGKVWAGGVAGQMRQVCDQFTEPYVPTITSAITTLQSRVVDKLDLGINDDWLNLGDAQSDWDGDFAYNFRVFYNNYNDVVARFGVFCGQINLGFSLGARIIAASQLAAGKFASSLKENLESQLDHWADSGGDEPFDPPEVPAWVGNLGAVVSSTIDLASDVPVVGEVAKAKSYYDKTTTVIGDVETLLGGDGDFSILPEEKTYEEIMTGSEAFDLLSDTLYGFWQDYQNGMDQLDAGGAGNGYEENAFSGSALLQNMKDVKSSGDFGLPDVPATNLN